MKDREIVRVDEAAPIIVTKALIRSYAQCVENLNPAYLSDEDAREAGFAAIIAPASFHGQYGYMRMAVGASNWVAKGALHTRQHFEFKQVVQSKDYLYPTVTSVRYKDKKDRPCLDYEVSIKNQRGELVCTGVMSLLLSANS